MAMKNNKPKDGETESIESSRPDGSGGGFLTRTQRNQAAFIKGITARCGCGDVESCKDCSAHSWSSQLLNADSGVSTEY